MTKLPKSIKKYKTQPLKLLDITVTSDKTVRIACMVCPICKGGMLEDIYCANTRALTKCHNCSKILKGTTIIKYGQGIDAYIITRMPGHTTPRIIFNTRLEAQQALLAIYKDGYEFTIRRHIEAFMFKHPIGRLEDDTLIYQPEGRLYIRAANIFAREGLMLFTTIQKRVFGIGTKPRSKPNPLSMVKLRLKAIVGDLGELEDLDAFTKFAKERGYKEGYEQVSTNPDEPLSLDNVMYMPRGLKVRLNKPAMKNSTVAKRGVSLSNGRYIARITIDSKPIFIGSYDTEELAKKAYDNYIRICIKNKGKK